MRIPFHGANDGNVVTPYNVGNIMPDPATCNSDRGYFLPCDDCLDLCPAITANGGTMVGMKFEIAIVPTKAKLLNLFWENLSTCPDVVLKLTYEDILGAEIEAILPAAAIAFTDDWQTVDTSHMYNFTNTGETGYIGRGDAGILVLEVVADPNNDLLDSCCGGAGACGQPMIQWGISYESAFVQRQVFSLCGEDQNPRDISVVDCVPAAMVTAWDTSARKTELGL